MSSNSCYLWTIECGICSMPLIARFMGPTWATWGRQDPGGPHVGHMKLAIWGSFGLIINLSKMQKQNGNHSCIFPDNRQNALQQILPCQLFHGVHCRTVCRAQSPACCRRPETCPTSGWKELETTRGTDCNLWKHHLICKWHATAIMETAITRDVISSGYGAFYVSGGRDNSTAHKDRQI